MNYCHIKMMHTFHSIALTYNWKIICNFSIDTVIEINYLVKYKEFMEIKLKSI